ncbi:MAG: hypothetical protein WC713_13040 [Candidatus Methylomirabilota bacterium]
MMPDADRRLRQVSQLRKLWRAFREPQERLEDARLSHPIRAAAPHKVGTQESIAPYGSRAVRAALRHWWTNGEYAAIVEFGIQLEPELLDDEPLLRIYLEEAAARLARPCAEQSVASKYS